MLRRLCGFNWPVAFIGIPRSATGRHLTKSLSESEVGYPIVDSELVDSQEYINQQRVIGDLDLVN